MLLNLPFFVPLVLPPSRAALKSLVGFRQFARRVKKMLLVPDGFCLDLETSPGPLFYLGYERILAPGNTTIYFIKAQPGPGVLMRE